MKFGYARVSTKGQNLDLQIQQLQQEGCEKIFTDVVSGVKAERPELDRMLEQVRAGDVIIIWKLDRLGRSLTHLIELVNKLVDQQVGLKSLNDPIDTTNSQGRLIFNIFASLAEFERDLIIERTQAGLKAARARGRVGGRPKGLSKAAEQKALAAASLYREGNLTVKQISENLGISKGTLYSYLRHQNIEVGTFRIAKTPKLLKVSIWMEVYNNSKHVRGKKRSIEDIELLVFSRYNMRHDRKSGRYNLAIPYDDEESLEKTINKILFDIHDTADTRHCYVECYIDALDGSERSWE